MYVCTYMLGLCVFIVCEIYLEERFEAMNTRSRIHYVYLFLSFAVFCAIWIEMTNRSTVHLFCKLSFVFVLIFSSVVRCPISSEITSRRTIATRATIQCSIR